jgi:subtilisin family serine protease
LTALLLPAAAHAQAAPPAPAPVAAAPDTPSFAPGQILVGVRAGAADARAASGADVVNALGALAGLDAAVLETFEPGAPGDDLLTHVVQVPAGSELEAVRALQAGGGVAYAEPNWTVWAAQESVAAAGAVDDLIIAPRRAAVEPSFPVNDPLYAADQWYLQRISMSRAWRTAYAAQAAGGFDGDFAPVVVAVIDSGLDADHPDFAGRVLPGVNYVTPGAEPLDDFGHGTHVAGLIAAGLNDSAGIAGPAPAVQIKPYKVLNAGGSGYVSDIAQALRDAAGAGVEIANMSLQAYTMNDQESETLEAAVKGAAAQGVLMIAAAGNHKSGAANPGIAYPARYPEVMAVAALDATDAHPYYSNYGPEVEIAAPGGYARSILSTWSSDAPVSAYCQSTYDGRYCTSIGTSQATGIVSGVAALLRALAPDLPAEDVRDVLLDTATPIGLDPQYAGRGKVNAYAAARRLLPGDLQASISQARFVLPVASGPRLATVRLDNPSLDAVTWKATLPATPWARLNNSSNGVLTGLTVADQPDFLTLTISPTALAPGIYSTKLAVEGTLPDGAQVRRTVGLQVDVGTLNNALFLPFVANAADDGSSTSAASTSAFAWELPADPEDRTVYDMDSGSAVASVPSGFAFPLRGRLHGSLRIYADGLVVFPLDKTAPALPNNCMPSDRVPQEAVYGWWADLNPGAAGAQVSTFALDGRFVIEFADVPSGGAQGVYNVSFQIVLYESGDVRLNYLDVPRFGGPPASITVGVEGGGGLFYNQLFCAADGRVFGAVPDALESYLIQAEDIF